MSVPTRWCFSGLAFTAFLLPATVNWWCERSFWQISTSTPRFTSSWQCNPVAIILSLQYSLDYICRVLALGMCEPGGLLLGLSSSNCPAVIFLLKMSILKKLMYLINMIRWTYLLLHWCNTLCFCSSTVRFWNLLWRSHSSFFTQSSTWVFRAFVTFYRLIH